MQLEFVRYEKRDRIAYVTIHRPEVMNALHPPAGEELARVWDDFAADPDVWVAILTGAGERAFSAGNDLKWTARNAETRWPKSGFGGSDRAHRPREAADRRGERRRARRRARDRARLRHHHRRRARHARAARAARRLLAAAGGVHRLPRTIPLKIAMGMLLTGKPITAAEAARLGLVNEVVPLAELMPTAERWARTICECSPLSVQATKQCAYDGLGRPLAEAMSMRYPAATRLFKSEDVSEGPRAFAEKRKPVWKGR